MAVFISTTTDPFGELTEARTRQPQRNIRRPLRGLQIKKDTYAVLRALTATGDEVPLFDSSSPDVQDGIGRSSHYANFIIQKVEEQRVEKQQIVETFGEDYIFFFGERPRFLNVSGVLINSKDFNWKNEFWQNYETYFRGTRLVEQNARLYLYFDDVVVEGYIVSGTTVDDSMQPNLLSFMFTMFVCNYAILSNVGSVFFQEDSVAVPPGGFQLVPDSAEAQAAAAAQAARQGSPGGLNGFLSTSQQFLRDANFTIQNTLETIRDTFYGRRIVVPQGLGASQILQLPITNLAAIAPAPTNQPIHTMDDEYVERDPMQPRFDDAEIARVNSQLKLRTPEQLEAQARALFARFGVDTTRRETTYQLLGRGAFAALQTIGSFGIRQASGTIIPGITAPGVTIPGT